MSGTPTRPSVSPEFDLDSSLLTSATRKSCVDERTLYQTPAPLAASTVARPGRMSERYQDAGGLGSFLESDPAALSDVSGLSDLGTLPLSMAEGKGVARMGASGASGGSTLKDDPSLHSLGNRSSLGLLNMDSLPDMTGSLLDLEVSPSKSSRMSSAFKSHSQLMSPAQTVPASSHSLLSFTRHESARTPDRPDKLNPADEIIPVPTKHVTPVQSSRSMPALDFLGGMTFGRPGAEDFDASLMEVQLEDEELKLIDDDFSDIGDLDHTMTDDVPVYESHADSGATLKDDQSGSITSSQTRVNSKSQGKRSQYEDLGQRGEATGHYDEDFGFRSRVGEGQEDLASMAAFLRSSSADIDYSQASRRRQVIRRSPVDSSEIDTDDEIAAVREQQRSWSGTRLRPGLEGVSADDREASLETRQSAEGDVVTSPVPGDGGGGGDGSSGHSSEDDSGHGGSVIGASQQTTKDILRGLGFGARGNQSGPVRGQHNPFTEDNPEAQQRIRPMGDDLLSEMAPRHVRFASPSPDVRSRTLSGASADDERSLSGIDQEPDEPFGSSLRDVSHLDSQFLAPSATSRSNSIVGDASLAFEMDESSVSLAMHKTGGQSAPVSRDSMFPESEGMAVNGVSFGNMSGMGDFSQLPPASSPMSDRGPWDGRRRSQDSCRMSDPPSFDDGKLYLSEDSPVYINTEGDVVTDLAYKTSLTYVAGGNPFDNPAGGGGFEVSGFGGDFRDSKALQGDDFVSADAALAMIDQDEKEFQEENLITQDDAMEDVSLGLPDSWTLHSTAGIDTTAAYSRLSIGTFMGFGSEFMGSLDDNSYRSRPTFGLKVATPPDPHKPPALLPHISPALEDIRESTERVSEDARPASLASEDVRGPGVGSDVDGEAGDRSLRSSQTRQKGSTNSPQRQSSPSRERLSTLAPVGGINADISIPETPQRPSLFGDVDHDQPKSASSTPKDGRQAGTLGQDEGLDISVIKRLINAASTKDDPQDLVAMFLKASTSSVATKNSATTLPKQTQQAKKTQPSSKTNSTRSGTQSETDLRRKGSLGSSQNTKESHLKKQNVKGKPESHVARSSNHGSRPSHLPGRESSAKARVPTQRPSSLATGTSQIAAVKPSSNGTSPPSPQLRGRPSPPSSPSSRRVEGRDSKDRRTNRLSYTSKIPVSCKHGRDSTGSASGKSEPASKTPEEVSFTSAINKDEEESSELSPSAEDRMGMEVRSSNLWKSPRLSSVSTRSIRQRIGDESMVFDESRLDDTMGVNQTDLTGLAHQVHKIGLEDDTQLEDLTHQVTLHSDSLRLSDVSYLQDIPEQLWRPGSGSTQMRGPTLVQQTNLPSFNDSSLVDRQSSRKADLQVLPEQPKPTLLTQQSLSKTAFATQYLLDDPGDQYTHRTYSQTQPLSQMRPLTMRGLSPERPRQTNTSSPLPQYDANETIAELGYLPDYEGYGTPNKRHPAGQGFQESQPMFSNINSASAVPVLVEVPQEVLVQEVCCVGLSAQAVLPIFNPSPRWLNVDIRIVRLLVGLEEHHPQRSPPFVFKERVVVEPNKTENVKVIFAPREAAVHVAELHVSASPVSDLGQPLHKVPSIITLQGVAEQPNVQVLTKDVNGVDFGALTWGCENALPVVLLNRGQAKLPVRLVIAAKDKSKWQCFSFGRNPSGNSSLLSHSSRAGLPMVGMSILNATLPPANSDDLQPVHVNICFKAPMRQLDKVSCHLPAEEFTAQVTVEVDMPRTCTKLASFGLRAVVGTARLHTPRDLEVVQMQAELGRVCERVVTLRNAGNIPMDVSLEITHWPDFFKVIPEHLSGIQPKAQEEVVIRFQGKPSQSTRFESLLLMLVEPGGLGYEVELLGEIGRPQPPLLHRQSKEPLLLSNRHHLAWGGVAIGRALQQTFVLKSSMRSMMKVRLHIRGNGRDFQLQSSFGRGQHLGNSKEVMLRPQEEYPIHVMFLPSQVAGCQASLRIQAVQENLKYSIPLSGYGGISDVAVEHLQTGRDPNTYCLSLGPLTVAHSVVAKVTLRNRGSRAAYVKALPFQDLECRCAIPSTRLTVQPNEFCLQPGQTMLLAIIMNPSEREVAMSTESAAIVATVAFIFGDEVSRQRFRRSLHLKTSVPFQQAEGHMAKDLMYDVTYQNEEKCLLEEDMNLKATPSDHDLFYSSMRRLTLALIATPPPPVPKYFMVEKEPMKTKLFEEEPTTKFASPQNGYSPPVKGTSDTHVRYEDEAQMKQSSCRVLFPADKGGGEDKPDWIIKPTQLILTAPLKESVGAVKRVQIINYSSRPLEYSLLWPGHCVVVTPEQGTVPPKSSGMLCISPNSVILSKGVTLPWSGEVHVICGEQKQVLRVQIRQELAVDESLIRGSADSPQPLVREPATPCLSIKTPASRHQKGKPRSELANDGVDFPDIPLGKTVELPLELTNESDDPIKWIISSVAPAYIKERGSGIVCRATYSAFWLAVKAGILRPRSTNKVMVNFCPRVEGQFSQYWEVRYQNETSLETHSASCKLEFKGQGIHEARTTKVAVAPPPEKKVASPPNLTTCSVDTTVASTRGMRIYLKPSSVTFPSCRPNEQHVIKVFLCNRTNQSHEFSILPLDPPFYIHRKKEGEMLERRQVSIPVYFQPEREGQYKGLLRIHSAIGNINEVLLQGICSS